MSNTFKMIPEEDESWLRRKARKYTRNILSTIRRSWTIKTLKHEYGPVVITLLGVAVAFLCLFTFSRAERWILNEKIVITPGITWVRTAKAEMTKEQYIRHVFGKEADTALKVAKAESGMRCDAQNVNKGTNSADIGIFQINTVHLRKGWKVGDLLDCKKNIDFAKEIYDGSGWGAWSVCKTKVKCK